MTADAAEDPVELVMRGFAAFGRGDFEEAMANLGGDVEWHHADSMPFGGVYHGADAVRDAAPRWMHAFSAIRFSPEEVHLSGETVWVIGTMEATPRGGEPISTWFVHAYTVRDGRYVRMREWTDMGRLLDRQTGGAGG